MALPASLPSRRSHQAITRSLWPERCEREERAESFGAFALSGRRHPNALAVTASFPSARARGRSGCRCRRCSLDMDAFRVGTVTVTEPRAQPLFAKGPHG